ncbi:unknown [Prevotella sp. CAG:1124]|nr:unknown [Prevotella sp. CAG:1124]
MNKTNTEKQFSMTVQRFFGTRQPRLFLTCTGTT